MLLLGNSRALVAVLRLLSHQTLVSFVLLHR